MSRAMPPITLLTDFGRRDAYVGILHGVLAMRAPGVSVIDLCHEVPPQDVERAGRLLASAAPWFPEGTVHVAVVDPGVGSERRIVATEARRMLFLAPDNGLLAGALERDEVQRAVRVDKEDLFLRPVSQTFHGRDIFAPVAAFLATGGELDALGPRVDDLCWPSEPERVESREGDVIVTRGSIVDFDHFGNGITDLTWPRPGQFVSLSVGGHRWERLTDSYSAVDAGVAIVLPSSTPVLEIAVSMGDAARTLGLRQGDRCELRWRPSAGS